MSLIAGKMQQLSGKNPNLAELNRHAPNVLVLLTQEDARASSCAWMMVES